MEKNKTSVSILGCGRWASGLAWYSAHLGYRVILWGRESSRRREILTRNRQNEYLKLPVSVSVESSLEKALSGEIILIAINSQNLRALSKQISRYSLSNKTFILCMKGLEEATGKRLSEVFQDEIGRSVGLAVWLGPAHVQELIKNIPTCMVIASEDIQLTRHLVSIFGSELIRFYYGRDLIGAEVGAAAKNVMGIAAGMLDGLGISSLKGALMARGPREISRLVKAMGGDEMTVYGLTHIGDYAATLFSSYSHNRRFGEAFVRHENFDKLAEGVTTTRALIRLSKRYDVELPICEGVYKIVEERQAPDEVLEKLFLRPTKYEF